MKFIQLKPGVFVRKSDVVAVEALEEGGSRVLTLNTSYDTPWMAQSILELVEQEGLEELLANQPKPEVSSNNLWGAQHWAG